MGINIEEDAMIGGDVNINQTIVERQKSQEELKHDRMNRYRAKCREVYLDGIVEENERTALDILAAELHLTKDEAGEIEDSEASISGSRKTTLDKVSLVFLKQIVKKVRAADMEGVAKLFSKLRSMANNFEDENVQFYYYMLLSVFNPNECIRLYESRSEDKYWQSYWTVMSCMKTGKRDLAETIKGRLANWKEYEEENILLLEIATAILIGDMDTADALREVVEATYSPALQDFAEALFLIVMHEDIANSTHTICYVDGMFASVTGRARIGAIQPDGTLSSSDTASTTSGKSGNNAIGNVIKKKEKKIAMKDVIAKPFSKEECDRLRADGKIEIEEMRDGIFEISTRNTDKKKYGLWDSNNERLILDIEYKHIYYGPIHSVYLYDTQNGGSGFVCIKSMKRTIDDDYIRFDRQDENLILVEKDTKYDYTVKGYIDLQSNTFALEPICKSFRDYRPKKDGYVHVQDCSNKWGIFSYEKRELVVDCKYEGVGLRDNVIYILMKNNDRYDLFIPDANIIYTNAYGTRIHDFYDNIIFIYKTKEGPYAICNANRKDNQIVYYDDFQDRWYDDDMDENGITPLVFVMKDDKWGLLDAESGAMVLDIEYDDWGGDGIHGSPCMILEKDDQTYTFNMFTRKFE